MARNDIAALLEGDDRRSIGRSEQVVAMVYKNRELFRRLIACLWSADPLVRMRAADAAEKITRKIPELLAPHRTDLLDLLASATQQELRWHLAVMVPRLPLSSKEQDRAISSLNEYLQDRSSIVRTFALQGLTDLTQTAPRTRAAAIEVLRNAAKKGTPAMKARSRKLLSQLESR